MTATVTRSDEAPAPPGRNLYVYGVVPAGVTLDLADAPAVEDGAAVRVVRRGEVAALVSPISTSAFTAAGGDDITWLEAPVRAHEAVLERALSQGPVVPMRFGTVVDGEDALGSYLDEHGGRLAEKLRELEGKREWGVKAHVDEVALRARLTDEGGEPARSEGAAYLARKQAERRAEQEVAAEVDALAADLHERLSAAADRAAFVRGALASADRRAILNAAYLVATDDDGRFHGTAESLRTELAARGVEILVTGPWPPYSFVGDDV